MKSYKFSEGDIVKMPSYLKNCGYPRSLIGRILKIDGSYIDVQPTGCYWIAEFYESELKLVEKCNIPKKKFDRYRSEFYRFYNFVMNNQGGI